MEVFLDGGAASTADGARASAPGGGGVGGGGCLAGWPHARSLAQIRLTLFESLSSMPSRPFVMWGVVVAEEDEG